MRKSKVVVPLSSPTAFSTEQDELVPAFPLDSVRSVTDTEENSPKPTLSQKSRRYRALWRKAFTKIKLDRMMKKVGDEILIYGTQNELLDQNMQYKANIDDLINRKVNKQENFRRLMTNVTGTGPYDWLIVPGSKARMTWNGVVCVLLIYTAFVMPWRIAFENVVFWDGWTIFELFIDVLFFSDVIITFFTLIVHPDGTIISSHWSIAKLYLRSWFLIDLTACIPFPLIEYLAGVREEEATGRYNSLVRLFRLPRLYKLFRIARVLRLFQSTAVAQTSNKISEFLQINTRTFHPGLWKLVKFLLSVSVCVHVSSCLWFFTSRLTNFDNDTWVVRYGFADYGKWTQYLTAVYWAVTTVTTVGYGDIAAGTIFERAFAVSWMLIGVGFYSFTIGSLSSLLTSIDSRESVLSSKLAAVQEFAKETGISKETKLKIHKAVRDSAIKRGLIWSDKTALLMELPKNLRFEVASTMYKGIYKLFPLFKDRDSAFISHVMPRLKPLRCVHEEMLYKEGDFADEVYFVSQGRVNLITTETEVVYKSFLRGSFVGEIEIVLMRPRLNNAQCFGECQFLVITREDFREAMTAFPTEAKRITKMAKERAKKNLEAYKETVHLLELKRAKGSLKELAGHHRLSNIEEAEETSEDESNAVHE